MLTPVQSLMTDFAKALDIKLPEPFEFPLRMNFDDLIIVFEYDADQKPHTLCIHSSLGVLPTEHEQKLYRALLEANLFWSGTADATIGVNSATNEAVIAYPFDIRAITGAMLVALVEQFTILTELWRRFIEHPPVAGHRAPIAENRAMLHNKA